MQGLVPRTLACMRALFAAWPQETIVRQAAAQLPWGHPQVLLDRLDDQPTRAWNADQAVQHGWSRSVLTHHITTERHRSRAATQEEPGTHEGCPALPPDLPPIISGGASRYSSPSTMQASSEGQLEHPLLDIPEKEQGRDHHAESSDDSVGHVAAPD